MRILIIEDEDTIREQLASALKQHHYAVDCAGDGEEGLFLGNEHNYDSAIVDIGLPRRSGLDVIRSWRAKGRTFPVLILTAHDRWQEKVEGLESGADDYLTKPFHIEELVARVKALVRRSAGHSSATIECGPIRLDTQSQTVSVNSSHIELTAYEYKILEYLILQQPRVLSKTELVEHVYDQDFDRDSNVIEVFIRRLRIKLDPDNAINPIETLRGRGYRFNLSCSL